MEIRKLQERIGVVKTVADQVIEAPMGTVTIVETSIVSPSFSRLLGEVLMRTGKTGWVHTHRNNSGVFGLDAHRVYLNEQQVRTLIERAEREGCPITIVTGGEA